MDYLKPPKIIKMHRVPRSSNVRRCLFPDDDVATQAKVDNSTNYLQESIERDIKEKIQKWNFDFENDVPLEGIYEWTPCIDESPDWIGRKIVGKKNDNLNVNDDNLDVKDDNLVVNDDHLDEKDVNVDRNKDYGIESDKNIIITEDFEDKIEKEPVLSIKEINEITPRNYRVEELLTRKRKNDIIDAKDLDKGVRRKISFD